MGWKTLKNQFQIEHTVHINKGIICIGSDYVPDMVTIDPDTGAFLPHRLSENKMKEYFPLLVVASKEEILSSIKKPDEFLTSIPVYTYSDGVVIEKQCEAVGWPNVTHDGCIMYDNSYSPDKQVTVVRAKEDIKLAIKFAKEQIETLQNKLVELNNMLQKYENAQLKLNAEYPE